MRRIWDSLQTRKNRGRPGSRDRNLIGQKTRRLAMMELEPRWVLSADFALSDAALVIDGFDASSDTITIAQVGEAYQFTLAGGGWTNTGSAAAGVSVDGSTLSVDASVVEPLAGGLRVVATSGRDLEVLFGDADFGGLVGEVSIEGARRIDQAAETLVIAPLASALTIATPTSGTTIGGMNTAGDFRFVANGPIIDAPGTQIRIGGDLTVISRPGVTDVTDLNANGIIDADDVSLWASGFGTSSSTADVNNDTIVSAADFTAIRDLAGATTGSGGIFLADNDADELIVEGKATFIAQSADGLARFDIQVGVAGVTASTASPASFVADSTHTASEANVQFGSLSVFGGDTIVVEAAHTALPDLVDPANDNGTVLDDSDVSSLYLISAGPITDTDTTDVAVAGSASFAALGGAAITLDDVYNFGTVTFNGGDVEIVEQSGTQIVGDNTAAGLLLRSAGPITDSVDGSATIDVAGNASFASTTGEAITLDDPANTFGSLTLNGGDAIVVEADGTELSGSSLVNSLDLDSGGDITDAAGAVVTVVAKASFDASPDNNLATDDDHDITFDSPSLNFGSLEFRGDQVRIDEASGTVLTGTNLANTLRLVAAGSIVDDGSVSLVVEGEAEFESTTDEAITLDDAYRFGFLSFRGGAVFIREADETVLFAPNEADSLRLESAGGISHLTFFSIVVTNNASFRAINGDSILIGSDGASAEFGSLTFDGGDVSFMETGDTVLSGKSDAASLVLISSGSIADDGSADVDIVGNASFTAVGNPITLDDTYDFGSLSFIGAEVLIIEDSDTNLLRTSFVSNTLDLRARGAIRDDDPNLLGTSSLSVTNNAKFTSITGDEITLDETVSLGSLTFMGGDVTIVEADSTLLSGVSVADTLELSALGTITDDGTADVTVIGNAAFSTRAFFAIRQIALTGDASDASDNDVYRFGSLTFDSNAVEISEQDGTELAGDSRAETSLLLRSGGSITDAADATLFVTTAGAARFEADGSIVLADAGADNIVAFLEVSFNAGLAGAGNPLGDDILVGVAQNGDPADAVVLLNVLNINAPGEVIVIQDGGVAPPVSPLAATDEALTEFGDDDLTPELDPFADDLAA